MVYLQDLHAIYLEQLHGTVSQDNERRSEKVVGTEAVQRFSVQEIVYKFIQQEVVAVLELKGVNGELETLNYRLLNFACDFLVLASQYDAVKKVWEVDDRCVTIIEDEWWAGTVTDFHPDEAQQLTVEFDSNNKRAEYVGRWEVEQLTRGINLKTKPTKAQVEEFGCRHLPQLNSELRQNLLYIEFPEVQLKKNGALPERSSLSISQEIVCKKTNEIVTSHSS